MRAFHNINKWFVLNLEQSQPFILQSCNLLSLRSERLPLLIHCWYTLFDYLRIARNSLLELKNWRNINNFFRRHVWLPFRTSLCMLLWLWNSHFTFFHLVDRSRGLINVVLVKAKQSYIHTIILNLLLSQGYLLDEANPSCAYTLS